jgi:orotidine-5'-phosphate decarboxylase
MTEPRKAPDEKTDPQNKIIVALDVDTAAEARSIIAELKEDVGAFKIGLQLFTAAGPSFVREMADSGANIFLDLKFHDIPNTVAKAAVEAARLGVWMFNVHALGGSEMMRRTVEAVADLCERESRPKPKIIAVTVLTSADKNALEEVGIDADPEKEVVKLARLTAQCGLDGVVASPREIASIRKALPDRNFLIVTPGIRPDFATIDDQRRVMTPKEAVAVGSDFLVIGRPITQAPDRRSALRSLIAEIGSAS